jgi:transcriptional regulator with XRE-family HTH domain
VVRVSSGERAFDRGTRLGQRFLRELGEEFVQARLNLGVSQEHVASASHVSRPRLSKIERGKSASLQVVELARIATVLGLDPAVRVFPGGAPVRDEAHHRRLTAFLSLVTAPMTWKLEVPLPALPDRPERRAWDAVIHGARRRTAVELEMRLHDAQALERRISLKRRDDPTDSFILLVADTRNNRRVLAEFGGLFADLPRLRPSVVRAALAAGRHPPSGLLLV